MHQNWLTDRLEFSDYKGSRRFKFDKPNPSGPIVLYKASGDRRSWETEKIPGSYAVPLLYLLARDAANGGEGLKNEWIYPVIFSGLTDPIKPVLVDRSKADQIRQEIARIRVSVGKETVGAIRGGYRLVVKANATPFAELPQPSTDKEEERKPSPGELRSETQTGLSSFYRPSVAPTQRFVATLSMAVSVVVAALILWISFRLTPAQYKRPGFYPFVWTSIVFIAIALAASLARRLRKTGLAAKDRISIHVAALGGDNADKDAKKAILASIRKELDTSVKVLEADIQLSATLGDYDAAEAKAREYLKDRGGDVLIWGDLYSELTPKPRVYLRFTTVDFGYVGHDTFGFIDHGWLDVEFGPQLGKALAAIAESTARSTVHDGGRFLSAALKPASDKLEKLLSHSTQMYAVDRGSLLHAYGLIQLRIGDECDDDARLERSIAAFRAASNEISRARLPLLWGATRNSLGQALMILGTRQPGVTLLEDALAAFQEALVETASQHTSTYRAIIHNNLGIVLRRLGERQREPDKLEEALAELRAALAEKALETAPLHRAMIQANLGGSLLRLGQRETESKHLTEAVEVLRNTARLLDSDKAAFLWSTVQNNLGIALVALSEREGERHLLEEAESAVRAALTSQTRDGSIHKRALLKVNLGITLVHLGALESGTEKLREAVAVTEFAVKELDRKRAPLDWAMAQNTLGNALRALQEREEGIESLRASERAFRQAIEEWTQERVPLWWAMAKYNLALTIMLLGEQEHQPQRFKDAVVLFNEAMAECTRVRDPLNWSYAQNGLGLTLMNIGLQERQTGPIEEAIQVFREVLSEWTPEQAPAVCKVTLENLETAQSALNSLASSAQ